jgi:hypothetical protein
LVNNDSFGVNSRKFHLLAIVRFVTWNWCRYEIRLLWADTSREYATIRLAFDRSAAHVKYVETEMPTISF